MTPARMIDGHDLCAYVDGELDAERLGEVERWLAQNPDDAAKVHAYRVQKSELHDLFDAELSAPLPAGVVEALDVGARRRGPSPWMQIAAGLVIFVFGGLAGWGIIGLGGGLGGGLGTEAGAADASFVRRAINAHAVFTHDPTRPVEITAAENTQLVNWLSGRLKHKLRTPDLAGAGFKLLGGRLLADQNMPAAQFMYEGQGGKRVTLYVRPVPDRGDTAFRFVAEQGMVAFYWIDGTLSYALIGEMPRGDLLDLAQMVFRDIEANT